MRSSKKITCLIYQIFKAKSTTFFNFFYFSKNHPASLKITPCIIEGLPYKNLYGSPSLLPTNHGLSQLQTCGIVKAYLIFAFLATPTLYNLAFILALSFLFIFLFSVTVMLEGVPLNALLPNVGTFFPLKVTFFNFLHP